MSTHSPGANYENDDGNGALDNLHCFLTGDVVPGVSLLEPEDIAITIPPSVTDFKKSKITRCILTYISGFIAKKLLKQIDFDICKQKLLYRDHDKDIEARQYNHSRLVKPGTFFTFITSQPIDYFISLLDYVTMKTYLLCCKTYLRNNSTSI